MRSRGIYLLLATAASVGAMLLLAGPAAASNLTCGETLTSSVTLIGNLDCSATSNVALYIGHDGVTLNLNGFWVKGATGYNMIDNESSVGTTIKNGTVYGSGGADAISNDNGGGDNLTVDVVNIVGDKSSALYGVDSRNSSGLSVVDSSFSGLDVAVYLSKETGDLIKNNTIETCSTGNCGGTGVGGGYLTGVTIMGNAFTSDAPQTGYAYYADKRRRHGVQRQHGHGAGTRCLRFRLRRRADDHGQRVRRRRSGRRAHCPGSTWTATTTAT